MTSIYPPAKCYRACNKVISKTTNATFDLIDTACGIHTIGTSENTFNF